MAHRIGGQITRESVPGIGTDPDSDSTSEPLRHALTNHAMTFTYPAPTGRTSIYGPDSSTTMLDATPITANLAVPLAVLAVRVASRLLEVLSAPSTCAELTVTHPPGRLVVAMRSPPAPGCVWKGATTANTGKGGIVGTVLLSLGASFGLSVLVWQFLLGIQIEWMVPAMSLLVLFAVGSDYNLLLVSRIKEEIGAGINTGIIRAMGGTGKVVTNAGLVFAFTMASMVVSDLRIIGQVGTTIGLGLLFDTLIVRAFMTPSIAALLGRWFWWPQRVRPRPASALLRPLGPRPLVRALLLRQPPISDGFPVQDGTTARGSVSDRSLWVTMPGDRGKHRGTVR
jgi:hypothetical protein